MPLFRDGNYGMFINWGLYWHLGGQWRDRTFYGIGEWNFATQVSKWQPAGKAFWDVEVCAAGDYRLELIYKGEDRPVWRIETDEGMNLQNQVAASTIYHTQPFGLLTFKQPGKHTITVTLVDGAREKTSLESIRLTPTDL